MGDRLKATLRRLCVEIGWSYVVFWRAIRLQNQMHLVWEDGHEALGVARSAGGLFAYKTMATQVHVVGDGVLGQAALTGNHRWILWNALSDYGSIPMALVEMNQQFLAGIQTIAIIPVLPYGVLQLGSTQMVMENIEFINHMKNLFGQLLRVPRDLVSDVTNKPLRQNIDQNASLRVSTPLNQYGYSGTYISRCSSSRGDRCHNQPLQAPNSNSVSQPCSLFSHLYGKVAVKSLEVSSTTVKSSIPLPESSQPTIRPIVEPILHHHNQLESESIGAQVVFSDPERRSIENAVLHDSSSASQHQLQLPLGLSSRGLTLSEEQLLSLSSSQELANKYMPNSSVPQLEFHGSIFSSSPMDSNNVLSSRRSDLPNNVNDLGQCSSFPPCTTKRLKSRYPVFPSMEAAHSMDHSNSNEMVSTDPRPKCSISIQTSQTVLPEVERGKEEDLFQTLDTKSPEFKEHGPFYGSLFGIPQLGSLCSLNPVQESKRTSVVSAENNASAPSSQNNKGIDNFEPLLVLNKKTSASPVWSTQGNDMFDLLGLSNTSVGSFGEMFGNDANANESSADISTCTILPDMGPVFEALNTDIYCSRLFSESSPNQLLDAVVGQINTSTKDDNLSCKTSLTNICSSIYTNSATLGRVGSSEEINDQCTGLSPMLVKPESATSNSVISGCTRITSGGCPQKDAGYKSQISLWVENSQSISRNSISAAHGKQVDEEAKLSRKRSRPGENPRPRPKDRQMIQDRVKELREIVPSGAKCSIDALLEKTIKHMIFLQSVTKHADKLKEVGDPKIVSKDGSLLLKDNFEGGATWAFEVGSQSMICPIIVEDLKHPRQMLVEMFCEEQGLFLEIADLIRGLGLTILKGVMESRKSKVWARFTVEANRDVTRMEIFLSLVHQLKPNAGSCMVPQGVESVHMPPNTYHPTSITAAGLSDRLR